MAKTNKAAAKRLKLTRTGKLLRRAPGQNHFNAKARRVRQLGKKGWTSFTNGKKAADTLFPFN